MSRPAFALLAALALATQAQGAHAPRSGAAAPPNVVIVFTDDQGYGDLGCFGAKDFATPNIDKLAKAGVRFTDFHVSQPVCSASRASLLTGCYSNRIGIHGALGPNAKHGIGAEETTIAEVCKSKGYTTAAVGKWHLGHRPEFLPTRHGFDSYLGLPYSNDMWPEHPEAKKGTYPPLPLIDGEKVVNPNVTAADQAKLTRQYTERAVRFIAANKSKPFFLYVAHSMPHVPLFAGDGFKGKSKQGTYGDVIQEIDWSVGEILKALDEHELAENTLVIFTSDNGPWLSYGNHAGSSGGLREGKGTVWEGGVRVPFVARWPGKIPAGSVCREPAMTIDVLPTVAKIVGAELPKLPIDGKDIGALLRGEPGAKCPQAAYFHYYHTNELHAVRSGKWKLVLPHTYRTMQGQEPGKDGVPGKYRQVKLEKAELYDLAADVNETTDVAAKHPDVVKELQKHAERAREELGDSLTKRVGKGVRPAGQSEPAPPKNERPPNIVLILADDLGYGDLGCYGNKKIRTPNLDQLAKDGTRFTSFYVSQGVCTASRASIMTGCYANRVSMSGALNHQSKVGLHTSEQLLPELLKAKGYATACYGKWHLGDRPPFLPTKRGFDDFAGLPYSNDNGPFHPTMKGLPPLPFYRGDKIVEKDPDQSRFTRRFTDLAVEFVAKHQHEPFFLYLPHVMPHVPIFASPEFKGISSAGLYGDVVEELDGGVGEVLKALKRYDLESNTLVFFLSDNGPFLSYGAHAGSAGPLREGKLTAWEGGVRVPAIARWPGKVPAGRACDEPLMTIDLLPTLCKLAGAETPKLPVDGKDAAALLFGKGGAKSPQEAYFFYAGDELHAVRTGKWKLHLPHEYLSVNGTPGTDGKPAMWGKLTPEAMNASGLRGIASRHGYKVEKTALSLYDLEADVGEMTNVAEKYPEVVKELLKHAERAREELGDAITKRVGKGVRPCGVVEEKQ